MQEVDIRKYELKKADFPITVQVAARNLPVCQAVASRVQVKQGGQVTGSIPVAQEQEDPAHSAMGYQIPDPGTGPGADLIQNVDCWFPDGAPEDSRYIVTITSALGDQATTRGSRPTINPRTITLTFLYR
jgi:hypothetical protein